jgi:hypothetical protein
MGDRCIIVPHLKGEANPSALYLHWAGGKGAIKIMNDAAPFMRAGDMAYAFARLVGAACAYHPNSELSVGIIKGPGSLHPARINDYSHGDAGVILLDIGNGHWTGHAGYLRGEMGDIPMLGLK